MSLQQLLICVLFVLFQGLAPSWVYVACGLAIPIYFNLDCIDGKQARRTGSSSPLGQLFDHAVDGYSMHLLVSSIMTCAGCPCGYRSMLGSGTVRKTIQILCVLPTPQIFHTVPVV